MYDYKTLAPNYDHLISFVNHANNVHASIRERMIAATDPSGMDGLYWEAMDFENDMAAAVVILRLLENSGKLAEYHGPTYKKFAPHVRDYESDPGFLIHEICEYSEALA